MGGSFRRLVRNLRRSSELTRAERDALLWALHLHDTIHTGMLTGRNIRRATMLGLVAKGFAEERQLVVCDDDGFRREPERWRDGFVLTPAGMQLARTVEAEDWEALRRIAASVV